MKAFEAASRNKLLGGHRSHVELASTYTNSCRAVYQYYPDVLPWGRRIVKAVNDRLAHPYKNTVTVTVKISPASSRPPVVLRLLFLALKLWRLLFALRRDQRQCASWHRSSP